MISGLVKKPCKDKCTIIEKKGFPREPFQNIHTINACLLSSESRNFFQTGMNLSLFTYKTLGLKHGFDLRFD